MLRKIKLYGQLAKFVGHKVLEADVSTAAEAVRFLVCNWPELQKHMAEQHYKVEVGTWNLSDKELHYPAGLDDVSIIPVVGGAGSGGTQILLGAALIGLSFTPLGIAAFSGGTGLGLTATSAVGTAATGAMYLSAGSAILGAVGASLVLGGVAQLLTPTPPTPSSDDDPQNSFFFSGVQQTSRAGVAVPVVYGEVMVGSVVISSAIDVNEVEA
tara:strand:+ start:2420 stop:3058 length:639 start_codon:yes stop_codon:yes gene_type:complete